MIFSSIEMLTGVLAFVDIVIGIIDLTDVATFVNLDNILLAENENKVTEKNQRFYEHHHPFR